ncbi:IclR family transcriptional regulator [Acuticoccus kandeliae]|uniref:IclR family transcriptional regulator n=1 Tax=Acuticoccus kandeliae TaxID=2073160 RepID=UPI000D3E1B52|nr:helix-turn-helix domain-containing protein [Acuticoccus kandeliae]
MDQTTLGGNVRSEPEQDDSAIDPRLFVGSVQKAMRVLEAFDRDHRTMSIAEVASRTGLGRSAAQRFVYTLEKIGYLTRTPQTREYMLSNRAFRFVQCIVATNVALSRSLPLLAQLAEFTGETVSWVELDGDEVVVIHGVPSPNRTAITLPVGSRFPALTASTGHLFLADLPRERVRRMFDAAAPKTRARLGGMDFDTYYAHVLARREAGYSLTEKEVDVSSLSVSVPVLDLRGRVTAGINVSVLRERTPVEKIRSEVLPRLTALGETASSFALG